MLLVLAAVVGVPVSAVAWGFLALVSKLQGWIFTSLPHGLGFQTEPLWWPIPPLLLAASWSRSRSGTCPEREGIRPPTGSTPRRASYTGPAARHVLAALATLSLGAVLGPEAPLIAIGAGLGAWAVRLAKRDAPAQTSAVMAAAGSFAAISALLGSPLLVPSC